MTVEPYESHDDVTEQVRRYSAMKLRQLLEDLAPYVDGSADDVSPAHGQLFLAAIKELGRLYQTHRPPKAPTGQMFTAEEMAQRLELVAAETEARVRAETAAAIAAEAAVTVEQGRDRVRAALEALPRKQL